MKTLILAAAILPLLTSVTAQSSPGYVGCYKSSGSLTQKAIEASNSPSACSDSCVDGNFTVEAMTKINECYCGTSLPPTSDKVEDSKCDASCPGSPSDTCGSNAGDFFSVYSTGVSPSLSVGTNNGTITTTSGTRNSTTSTTTGSSSETSTSNPTDTTRPTTTGSTGSAPTKTSGSTTSSTSEPNSGDSVQIGGGMLVGAVMGALAMVF
ncbi:hypothetical protein B9Z19DRAFT_1194068 [Tuber borchii]|uniref:WSC domain-containing protein n=1 Tax=Tuber borchii TaxID=42251 RepID=A0A2T6ZPK8_TUBBO|nr:hypothetical protein B9Z19DRAFT_1194068 [Tuber borchii]